MGMVALCLDVSKRDHVHPARMRWSGIAKPLRHERWRSRADDTYRRAGHSRLERFRSGCLSHAGPCRERSRRDGEVSCPTDSTRYWHKFHRSTMPSPIRPACSLPRARARRVRADLANSPSPTSLIWPRRIRRTVEPCLTTDSL